MEREEIFQELERRGVAEVRVPFSGGHDSGYAENPILLDRNGNEIGTLELYYETYHYNETTGTYQLTHPPTAKDLFVEALADPIYKRYGGFATERYITGCAVWNVLNRTLTIEDKYE